MRIRILLLISFLGLLLSCKSVKPLSTIDTIPITNNEFLIDGILNEKAWDRAFTINDFKSFKSKYSTDIPETIVKLLQTNNGLLFSAQVFTKEINAFEKERDGAVYKDNCFELFFDPDADGLNYYELEINALGTIWDLILKTSNNPLNHPSNITEWNLPLENIAVALHGTLNDTTDIDMCWIVEAFLPWDLFVEGKPNKGSIWKANFMRIDYVNDDPKISVWKPTSGKNIHVPLEWGSLKF